MRSVMTDICKLLHFSICLECSLIIAILALTYDFPVEFFLIPLMLYNSVNTLIILYRAGRGLNMREELRKNGRLFYISVYASDLLAKLCGFLYLMDLVPAGLILLFVLVPGILGPIFRKEYPTKFKRMLEFLHSSLRVCIVADLFLLTLNDVFDLEWGWSFILFPTLIYFSILSFLTLSLFLCYLIYTLILCNCSEIVTKSIDLVAILVLASKSGSIQFVCSILPEILETGSNIEYLNYPTFCTGVSCIVVAVLLTCFREKFR